MKIKSEYKGKTIIKHTTLGNMTIVVDNIDVKRYKYYVSIGLGYLFEKEAETTTADQPIKYEGIEQNDVEIQHKETKSNAKPKRKRKKGNSSEQVS